MSNGADFKLDIGPLQISSRTACQRYRQNTLDATSETRESMISKLKSLSFDFSGRTVTA